MSASTEALVEKIRLVEVQLAAEPKDSPQAQPLREQLKALQRQLNTANEALNEGKQSLLKG
jgi:hypothetical protein